MSQKIIYLLLAVSVGINLGVVGMTLIGSPAQQTQGPPPGPDGGGDQGPGPRPNPEQMVQRHLEGMTRHLDLDAEQQQAVRLIMEQHMPEQAERQFLVEKTGRELAQVFAAPDFDAPEFRRLTAAASRARAELDSLSTVMLVAEAEVLTPEQRQKFAAVAPSLRAQSPNRPPGQRPRAGEGSPPR